MLLPKCTEKHKSIPGFLSPKFPLLDALMKEITELFHSAFKMPVYTLTDRICFPGAPTNSSASCTLANIWKVTALKFYCVYFVNTFVRTKGTVGAALANRAKWAWRQRLVC